MTGTTDNTIVLAKADHRLVGWKLESMYPLQQSLVPLLGKTIVAAPATQIPPEPAAVDLEQQQDLQASTQHNATVALDVAASPINDDDVDIMNLPFKMDAKKDQDTDEIVSAEQPTTLRKRAAETSSSQRKKRALPSSFKQAVANAAPPPANASRPVASSSRSVTATVQRQPSLTALTYNSLNEEQKRAHDLVLKQKKNVFITGSAGTGKTVLLKVIIESLMRKYAPEQVGITASTGIAAVNIGGVTIHSFAHVGHGKDSLAFYVNKIQGRPKYEKRWLDVRVLVVDEVSMLSKQFLDMLDQLVRIVRRSNAPFGGVQVVFCGDFHQLPPVFNQEDVERGLAFEAECWARLKIETINLKKYYRQTNIEFVRMLEEVRNGNMSVETQRKLKALSRTPALNLNISPTELYPRVPQVNEANEQRLKGLPGEMHVFRAVDTGSEAVLSNCAAPHLLALKVGAQVMLVKNLSKSLVNGSVGIVIGFEPFRAGVVIPRVKFDNGEEKEMMPMTWTYDTGNKTHSRKQLPLRLAWAMSIHKAQGQTIEYVKVDLANAFENGQVYVALSRATCTEHLQVLNFTKEAVKVNSKVEAFYRSIEEADNDNDHT